MAWQGKGLFVSEVGHTQSFLRKVVGMETKECVTFTLSSRAVDSQEGQSI